MPVIKIKGKEFVDFGDRSYDKFWPDLSKSILDKYTDKPKDNLEIIEAIINDSLDFCITNFDSIIQNTTKRPFYNYVFNILSSGIKIWREFDPTNENPLGGITIADFSTNQRTLRLILEQATTLKLKNSDYTRSHEVIFLKKLEDLIFLGYWIYGFCNILSEIKIVGNCYKINFDENNLINFDQKQPYKYAYNHIVKEIFAGYSEGIFDQKAFDELKIALKECLGIDFDFSINLALEVKKTACAPHFEDYCTFQSHLLPLNYSEATYISYEVANDYYSGLTLTKNNKLSIKDSVLKANSLDRYFYRPFLELNINDENRILVTRDKVLESVISISINAINWDKAPIEWKKYKSFSKFLQKKFQSHDKILEDHIENILIENGSNYDRNIESFKPRKGDQIRIAKMKDVGEIDFLYLDEKNKKIIVADSKYHITRYDLPAHRLDYTNFVNEYEPKLTNKIDFVRNNIKLVEEHLQHKSKKQLDLSDYIVEGFFLVNTPVIYNYVGKYRAHHLPIFKQIIKGEYKPIKFMVTIEDNFYMFGEPYFKKAVDAANS